MGHNYKRSLKDPTKVRVVLKEADSRLFSGTCSSVTRILVTRGVYARWLKHGIKEQCDFMLNNKYFPRLPNIMQNQNILLINQPCFKVI